jgi:glycosyltransferase involved in cell wall biosynthesis
MDKRIKLGLIYSYDEGWIAGAYYIENLIHALNTLPDDQKPEICIFGYKEQDFQYLQNRTLYPYLSFYPINIKYNLIEKVLNKISRKIIRKNIIDKRPNGQKIDILFPANNNHYFELIPKRKKLYWIPDFQEHHLPHLFTESEINVRKKIQNWLVEKKASIVLSSKDAFEDFSRIYPNNTCNVFILNFAVSHPYYQDIDIEVIRLKYSIPDNYFFSPNQFWAHKNHITLLKAIKQLKERNINPVVIFSGKSNDYRNLNHYDELQRFIKDNKLENNAIFLGFIDRKEQLKIMEHAIAVIQPSLFEGWSTVVEDAKALNQFLVLSDLNVHKEQVITYSNTRLFEPNDEVALAEEIAKLMLQKPTIVPFDYLITIEKFGKTFNEIMKSIISI